MKILIAPFSRNLRNGNKNPKNYPYWKELITLLEKEGYELTQVGMQGEEPLVKNVFFNQSLATIKQLIIKCDLWVSVDSFLQHMAYPLNKKGIVIWGVSDPNIFGYEQNINILKDRRYLRHNQFGIWEEQPFKEEVFVKPDVVVKIIKTLK